jgi:hypothetical protein
MPDDAPNDAPDDAPEEGKVVYDLSEWEPDQVDTLEWALGREGVVAFLRDRELTIRDEDEARVDHLIDHLFDAVDAEGMELASDDSGDAGTGDMDALGDLFVAADRLTHRGDDRIVCAEFEEAVEAVAGRSLPYGFEDGVWARITTMASWLVDELDGAGPELIEEHAGKLRDLLRQYV